MNVQDWLAIGQFVVALVALFAIFQTHASLKLTREQIAAEQYPSLELAAPLEAGATLTLRNTGEAEIRFVEIIATASAYIDMNSGAIGPFQIAGRRQMLSERLAAGGSAQFALAPLVVGPARPKPDPNQWETLTIVVRYKNSKMHSFYLFLSYTMAVIEGKNTVHMPMIVSAGSAEAGIKRPGMAIAREALRTLCIDAMGLPENAGGE